MNLASPLPHPAWGGLVAAYFVLIGLPSGLRLMFSWLNATGYVDVVLDRTANWVSLVSLVVVGAMLVADLGRPERFYLMLTRFDRLSSPIAVGAKLIAVEGALLALTVYAERPARHRESLRGAAVPSLVARYGYQATRGGLAVVSFALALYPAAVLSRTWSSPLDGTSGSAMLFTVTTLVLGAGAATLLSGMLTDRSAVWHGARRALGVLLGGYAIAIVFEGLAIVGNPRLGAVTRSLGAGAAALPFWGGVVGLGIALPAAILTVAPGRRAAVCAAAIAAISGACFARYLLFSVAA